MAVGDLSADQARFVDRFAGAAGIDRPTVVAWVGCETGWGVTKPDHNYLNVGPGETYRSADEAAARAAGLINRSQHYGGIRAARPQGGQAVIDAIAASPWGSNPGCITSVRRQLVGGGAAGRTVATDPESKLPGPLQEIPSIPGIPSPQNPDGSFDLLGDVWGNVLKAGLGIVFSAAALGLIALGLSRLTDTKPRDVLGKVSTVSGGVGLARAAI